MISYPGQLVGQPPHAHHAMPPYVQQQQHQQHPQQPNQPYPPVAGPFITPPSADPLLMVASSRPFSSGSRQPPDPIDQYLAQVGYYRKHTARDSSSLYRCVSEQMFDTQNYHQFVRDECIRFMRRRPAQFADGVAEQQQQHHHHQHHSHHNQRTSTTAGSAASTFAEYVDDLARPRVHGSLVELRALARLYGRNVLLFEPYNTGTWLLYDERFALRPNGARSSRCLKLFYTGDGHFDTVYDQAYIEDAAFCQSLVYEIMYSFVFNLPDVMYAVERMLHDQPSTAVQATAEAKSKSTGTEGTYTAMYADGYPECLALADGRVFLLDRPERTRCVLENYTLCHFHNRHFDKLTVQLQRELFRAAHDPGQEARVLRQLQAMLPDRYTSCVRQLLMEGITPFPYKVAKALDPSIYRNVEYDTWSEQRKEHRMRFMSSIGGPGGNAGGTVGSSSASMAPVLQVGTRCLLRMHSAQPRPFVCHVQEVRANLGKCLVFIEELCDKRYVPIAALTAASSSANAGRSSSATSTALIRAAPANGRNCGGTTTASSSGCSAVLNRTGRTTDASTSSLSSSSAASSSAWVHNKSANGGHGWISNGGRRYGFTKNTCNQNKVTAALANGGNSHYQRGRRSEIVGKKPPNEMRPGSSSSSMFLGPAGRSCRKLFAGKRQSSAKCPDGASEDDDCNDCDDCDDDCDDNRPDDDVDDGYPEDDCGDETDADGFTGHVGAGEKMQISFADSLLSAGDRSTSSNDQRMLADLMSLEHFEPVVYDTIAAPLIVSGGGGGGGGQRNNNNNAGKPQQSYNGGKSFAGNNKQLKKFGAGELTGKSDGGNETPSKHVLSSPAGEAPVDSGNPIQHSPHDDSLAKDSSGYSSIVAAYPPAPPGANPFAMYSVAPSYAGGFYAGGDSSVANWTPIGSTHHAFEASSFGPSVSSSMGFAGGPPARGSTSMAGGGDRPNARYAAAPYEMASPMYPVAFAANPTEGGDHSAIAASPTNVWQAPIVPSTGFYAPPSVTGNPTYYDPNAVYAPATVAASANASLCHNTFAIPVRRRDLVEQSGVVGHVNLDARPSYDPRGYDIPTSDLGTLRFFYNLGHEFLGQLRQSFSSYALQQLTRPSSVAASGGGGGGGGDDHPVTSSSDVEGLPHRMGKLKLTGGHNNNKQSTNQNGQPRHRFNAGSGNGPRNNNNNSGGQQQQHQRYAGRQLSGFVRNSPGGAEHSKPGGDHHHQHHARQQHTPNVQHHPQNYTNKASENDAPDPFAQPRYSGLPLLSTPNEPPLQTPPATIVSTASAPAHPQHQQQQQQQQPQHPMQPPQFLSMPPPVPAAPQYAQFIPYFATTPIDEPQYYYDNSMYLQMQYGLYAGGIAAPGPPPGYAYATYAPPPPPPAMATHMGPVSYQPAPPAVAVVATDGDPSDNCHAEVASDANAQVGQSPPPPPPPMTTVSAVPCPSTTILVATPTTQPQQQPYFYGAGAANGPAQSTGNTAQIAMAPQGFWYPPPTVIPMSPGNLQMPNASPVVGDAMHDGQAYSGEQPQMMQQQQRPTHFGQYYEVKSSPTPSAQAADDVNQQQQQQQQPK